MKDFEDAQANYFSACIVKYNQNTRTGTHGAYEPFTGNEAEVESLYSKTRRVEYDTRLTGGTYALDLAARLGDRFSFLKETVKLAVGADTSSYNILDTVHLDVEVNGRRYSDTTDWIIKELDPAQDKLTLEASGSSGAWDVDALSAGSSESEYGYDFDGEGADGGYALILDGGGAVGYE